MLCPLPGWAKANPQVYLSLDKALSKLSTELKSFWPFCLVDGGRSSFCTPFPTLVKLLVLLLLQGNPNWSTVVHLIGLWFVVCNANVSITWIPLQREMVGKVCVCVCKSGWGVGWWSNCIQTKNNSNRRRSVDSLKRTCCRSCNSVVWSAYLTHRWPQYIQQKGIFGLTKNLNCNGLVVKVGGWINHCRGGAAGRRTEIVKNRQRFWLVMASICIKDLIDVWEVVILIDVI